MSKAVVGDPRGGSSTNARRYGTENVVYRSRSNTCGGEWRDGGMVGWRESVYVCVGVRACVREKRGCDMFERVVGRCRERGLGEKRMRTGSAN